MPRPATKPPLPFPVPKANGFVLYRLFNRRSELLYIGMTKVSLTGRLRGHEHTQPWWHEVVLCTAEEVESYDRLRLLEWRAIISERPCYNRNTSRPNLTRPSSPPPVFLGPKGPPLTPEELTFFMTGEVAS